MGRKKTQLSALADGATFAMPLADGRFGVCRVLRNATAEEAREWGKGAVLVACSAWIGEAIPDASEPTLQPILKLTHHAWREMDEVLWVAEPVPDDFISLGVIVPTSQEAKRECFTLGGWGSPRRQALAQWRWDNEREAVLAEDKAEEEAGAQQQQQHQQEHTTYLASVTLEQLQAHTFFPGWKTSPSKKAIRRSRQLMEETIQTLVVLGPEASEQARLAALQVCIENFNALDEELDYFIETVEREDICDEFEAIVHACGLGAYEDLADEWRDW